MAILIYNGIVLDVLRTNAFNIKNVMSEDNADYMYTQFSISVTAYLHPSAVSYALGPGPLRFKVPGVLAINTEKVIREALQMPRKKLIYYAARNYDTTVFKEQANDISNLGDEVETNGAPSEYLIVSSPMDGFSCDVMGGPTPGGVSIQFLNELTLWMVNFEVSTALRICTPAESSKLAPLLSCRWSQSHTVDERYLTTVATSGVAIFDLGYLSGIAQGVTADYFREYVIPPPPKNMRREVVQATVNTLGNVLTFSVVDREDFVSLTSQDDGNHGVANRYNVSRFQASITQDTSQQGDGQVRMQGNINTLSVRVGAQGNKVASKQNLRDFAFRLLYDLIRSGKNLPANQVGLVNIYRYSMTETIHEPSIVLDVQVVIPAPERAGGEGWEGLNLFFTAKDIYDTFGDGSMPAMPYDNYTRGLYTANLMASRVGEYISNECDPYRHGSEPAVPSVTWTGHDNVLSRDYGDYSALVEISDQMTLDSSLLCYPRADGSDSVYSDYTMNTRYQTQHFKITAPVAGPNGTASQTIVLSPSMTQKIVEYTAQTVGRTPPVVPSPNVDDNDKWHLHEATVELMSPIPVRDGNGLMYGVSGMYTFAANDSDGVAREPMPMGKIPFVNVEQEYTVMYPGSFRTDILSGENGCNPGNTVSSSGGLQPVSTTSTKSPGLGAVGPDV